MTRGISPPNTKRRKISQAVGKEAQHLPGSEPPLQASPNTLRLFSWNVNGIGRFLQRDITSCFKTAESSHTKQAPHPITSLRDFLYRHHWPAIFFLQEVKIAEQDTRTQRALQKVVNIRLPAENSIKGPSYEVKFTLPTDKHNARGPGGSGKVYGVCTIIRSDLQDKFDITERTRTVDWDKEGRVSVVELTSADVKFVLFNIYAVNGTDNPYRDSATGAVSGTRHDRKLEFHKFLVGECMSLKDSGWNVVIAGDLNVAPTRIDGYPNLRVFPHQHVINRADFLSKFLSNQYHPAEERSQVDPNPMIFDGVDVWRAMNPDTRRFTYYPSTREWGSSCDRIDYVIVNRELWDSGRITAAGMLDNEVDRGPSDHVPIWVDIQMGQPS